MGVHQVGPYKSLQVVGTNTADAVTIDTQGKSSFVIKAGPVHEVIRTNTVGEPVYASPAIANGTIYIRGERHLFAIGK